VEDLHEKMVRLREVLMSREEVIRWNQIEKEMENDETVLRLANEFAIAQSEYNACLNHFSADAEESRVCAGKLYEAKRKLDDHPLIREYYACFQAVNEPLRYLEYHLLRPLKIQSGKCKK